MDGGGLAQSQGSPPWEVLYWGDWNVLHHQQLHSQHALCEAGERLQSCTGADDVLNKRSGAATSCVKWREDVEGALMREKLFPCALRLLKRL